MCWAVVRRAGRRAPVSTAPAAQVVVNEPQPGEERDYQSARAVLDLAPGEYFVGQGSIATRLLLIDSNDELAR